MLFVSPAVPTSSRILSGPSISVSASSTSSVARGRSPSNVTKKRQRFFSARSSWKTRSWEATTSDHPMSIRSEDSTASATVPQIKPDMTRLGDLEVPVMGVGVWAWGDPVYWGYGGSFGKNDVKATYKASLDAGLNMFDTAEIYGNGASESLLGEFGLSERGFDADGNKRPVIVLSKFATFPWRIGPGSVVCACKESLKRLQLDTMDLYQIHFPGVWQNDEYVEGLADVVDQGLAKEVGVSNFTEKRLRAAHARLKARGVKLASNQVQYSLLYRKPELNGLLKACEELDVKLIAYSPISQGLLTGKYTADSPTPSGPRAFIYNQNTFTKLQPLIATLREIGNAYGGKTPAQVSLNWLICKGAVPIPGAKNVKQVQELAGAIGWRLDDGDVKDIEEAADKSGVSAFGAPFENM